MDIKQYQSLHKSRNVHYLRPRPLPPLPPRPRPGGPLPLPPPLPRPGAIHIFLRKNIIFIIPKKRGGKLKKFIPKKTGEIKENIQTDYVSCCFQYNIY